MGRRGWAVLLLVAVQVLIGIGGGAALFGLARVVDPLVAGLGASALTLGLIALATALALVARLRVLRGRIPICATCKQVRDPSGAWNRLEAYLEANSHAEFTHGICEVCQAGLHARTGRVAVGFAGGDGV